MSDAPIDPNHVSFRRDRRGFEVVLRGKFAIFVVAFIATLYIAAYIALKIYGIA